MMGLAFVVDNPKAETQLWMFCDFEETGSYAEPQPLHTWQASLRRWVAEHRRDIGETLDLCSSAG